MGFVILFELITRVPVYDVTANGLNVTVMTILELGVIVIGNPENEPDVIYPINVVDGMPSAVTELPPTPPYPAVGNPKEVLEDIPEAVIEVGLELPALRTPTSKPRTEL